MEMADAKTTAAAVAVSPILSSEDLHALHEARQRYLEQQTILREVEELLVHAAHTLDEDGSASALAAMGLAGCNRDAVTSLGKHLAAAHAAQRLRLPDAPPGAARACGCCTPAMAGCTSAVTQRPTHATHVWVCDIAQVTTPKAIQTSCWAAVLMH